MAKVERKARQSAVLWTQIAAETALSQDGTNTGPVRNQVMLGWGAG